MPSHRSLLQPHQQFHHQRHSSHRHHHQPSIHRQLSSFLYSVFLGAACCAVVFLSSAVASTGFDPLRQLSPAEIRDLAKTDPSLLAGDLPESDGMEGGLALSEREIQLRTERRKATKANLVKHIQKMILDSLNRSASSSSPNLSEMDSEAWRGATGMDGVPLKEELRPSTQVKARPPQITNRIKEFASEVPNLIPGVNGAVQFVLHPKQTPGLNGSQRVINATMKVLVRLHRGRTSSEQSPSRPRDRQRKRRITIVTYLLEDGVDAATADQYLPIAQLTVLVRKTNWHKVLLPTTIVQKVLDSADKVLRLRVLCLKCDDETEVVMTPRRTGKKKTGRKSPRIGRGRGGEGRKYDEDEDEDDANRKSLQHLASSVDSESRSSPVLIVSTRSSGSSRFRKTA